MPKNSPFKNPELMVIGDSLAQGCRSLSVTAEYCAQSYSAIIAAAQRWGFQTPAFPRPVLFDFEHIVRNYVSPAGAVALPRLVARVQRNLDEWIAHFAHPSASGPEWFDNLAVAGASIADMSAFTFANSQTTVSTFAGSNVFDLVRNHPDRLGEAHLAINSGYVLNPHGLEKYANWNMLRWVAERRPKRLVVHMGHNDGLYPIGSKAEKADIAKSTAPAYCRYIDAIEDATIASQQITFILLPKISSVANLSVSGGSGPDSSGYWPRYAPVFSTSKSFFDAAGMKEMDDGIKAANIRIRARLEQLQSKRNIRVIEAYDILEAKDFKNSRDPKRQIPIGRVTVDNRYLDGHSRTPRGGRPGAPPRRAATWHFEHGGFQSIDGMHPSAVGYAEVAMEVMKTMILHYDKSAIRAAALANESLVTKYPVGLQTLVGVLAILRAMPGRPAASAAAPTDYADTACLVEAAQKCVFRE